MLDWRDINVKSCHHTFTHTPSTPKAIPDLSKHINTKGTQLCQGPPRFSGLSKGRVWGDKVSVRELVNVERGKLKVLMRARSVSVLQGLMPADQKLIQSRIRNVLFQPFFWNTSKVKVHNGNVLFQSSSSIQETIHNTFLVFKHN